MQEEEEEELVAFHDQAAPPQVKEEQEETLFQDLEEGETKERVTKKTKKKGHIFGACVRRGGVGYWLSRPTRSTWKFWRATWPKHIGWRRTLHQRFQTTKWVLTKLPFLLR